MITPIFRIIKGTPLWIWPALGYLLYKGIRAFHPKIISIYKIFILPTLFLFLSLRGLLAQSGLFSFTLIIRLTALFIGSITGFLLFKNIIIEADKRKSLIRIPGTKSTLLLIFTVFAIKYYFGYKSAIDPILAKSFVFISIQLIITGIMSGITIGRALRYLYNYKIASHTDLT